MPKKIKPVTDRNMQAMALSVIRYLNRYHMFQDVNIYAGGMHYSDSRHHGQVLHTDLVKNAEVWAGERDRYDCPCEYHNPDTLTMTFEGPLYHAINYGMGRGYRTEQELDAIFARYGLYLEMGHAWSLTCWAEDAKPPEPGKQDAVPEPAEPKDEPACPEPVAYVLSMATNLLRPTVKAWQFPDMISAKAEMRRQLKARIEMDDPEGAEKIMSMMENGVEYSNMSMSDDAAHIYQDFAEHWHVWKITPVMPAGASREGGA